MQRAQTGLREDARNVWVMSEKSAYLRLLNAAKHRAARFLLARFVTSRWFASENYVRVAVRGGEARKR